MPTDAKPTAAVSADERYTLSSQADVVFLLTQMMRRGELFTVYFNSGREFLLTSILDVDASDGTFIFDLGSDAHANRSLSLAERLVFVAAPDGVRVQFATTRPDTMTYGEHQAFVAPLPPDIVKLQRRETFRVETPHREPLQMVIPQGPAGRAVLTLRNMSVGGAGVELTDEKHGFETVQRYFEAHIDLRDSGRIYTDIQVRHITRQSLKNDRWLSMMGVQFVTLSKVDQARLQRFLVYLERERRQLSL